MTELGICGDSDHLAADLLKFASFFAECDQFCRTDESAKENRSPVNELTQSRLSNK